MRTEPLSKVAYRPTPTANTVPAFLVCETTLDTILFVPALRTGRSHVVTVVRERDHDGAWVGGEVTRFAVESSDMETIARGLLTLSKQIR